MFCSLVIYVIWKKREQDKSRNVWRFIANEIPKLEFFSFPAGTSTVPPTTTENTTPGSNRSLNSAKPNKAPPACVLAVVNCCSRYDEVVRTPCFEKYNCKGAFFGRSPCSPDIKSAAFREVEKFSQRWVSSADISICLYLNHIKYIYIKC